MDTSPALEPQNGFVAPDEPLTTRDQDEQSAADLLARAAVWDNAIRGRDERLARELLHPGFAFEIVQPVRSVMKHDVWLEMLPDYVVHELEVEEQVVDLDGDYAALLQRVNMRATVAGEDRSGIFVLSDLWRRVGGEWVVWRRHSSPLSPRRLDAHEERER